MATVLRESNATVLELGPSYASLDVKALTEFGEVLLSEATYADPPHLILDLSKTNFVGSAFIELLVRAWKRISHRGGTMALCGAQPFCAEVLRAARLDSLWPSFPNRDEALNAAQTRGGS
jgi:anti-anti-sigma factor